MANWLEFVIGSEKSLVDLSNICFFLLKSVDCRRYHDYYATRYHKMISPLS